MQRDNQDQRPSKGAFELGEWLVEPRLNRLSCGEISVQLELKLMELLVFLAGQGGEVVSKVAIIDAVWQTEFIAENTLTHSIADLRRALGDDARNPRFIGTIPKRGYRIVAPVRGLESTGVASADEEAVQLKLVTAKAEYLLHEGENILGRSETADVRIDNERASRSHASITVEDGRAVIEDLGSKNGTYVQGERLQEPAELVSGECDIVRSGSLILVRALRALTQTWLPERGELALYAPTGHGTVALIDYVAWGRPGRPWSQSSERFALWPQSQYVPLVESFGVYDYTTTLGTGDSFGRYPRSTTSTARDWVVYSFADTDDQNEVTPGTANSVPKPKAFNLPYEASVSSSGVAIAWPRRRGDERYHFQLATDDSFTDLLANVKTVHPAIRIGFELDNQQYYYRAKACSGEHCSVWSARSSFESSSTPCGLPQNLIPPAAYLDAWLTAPSCYGLPRCKILESIRFKFSRKDSRLRCVGHGTGSLDPCDLSRWDSPHKVCQAIVLSPGYHLK